MTAFPPPLDSSCGACPMLGRLANKYGAALSREQGSWSEIAKARREVADARRAREHVALKLRSIAQILESVEASHLDVTTAILQIRTLATKGVI